MTTSYCPSHGVLSSSSVGFRVASLPISNKNSLLSSAVSIKKNSLLSSDRTGDQVWLRRRRRWRGHGVVICAVEENPNPTPSSSILREDGNSRRAARRADSVIQRIENAKDVMERRALAKMSNKLYPRSLLESLEERIEQNRWDRALNVFQLIRLQQWYTAQDSTYIKLLQLLAKCKQPAAAASLFDSLLQDKLRPTTAIFTALLTVYTESNLLPKAFELFDSMPRFEGCLPDKYTYTALIKACCNASLYDQATHLFNQMTIAGEEPSIVTYNTLIFGYGKAGLFTEIEHVLTYMFSHNVQPDTVTWNTLIKVFGMHNKIPEMEQAYEGLLAQGLMPDIVTLNSLISAYGRAGLYGKMECVMDYMRRYSYPMDAVTYNAVIELYGKAGRIEEMERKFKEMKWKGVKPTCVTFSSILSAYGKNGRGELVEKVMRQVGSYVGDVDAGVYNAAMDACSRAMDYEGMERWFVEMKRAGIAADEISYGVLVEGYKRTRKMEKVEELLEEWTVLRSRKRRNL